MQSVYVALDLETTGLSAERDAIIEIGAVKFRGEEVLDEFTTLVNPGRRLPLEITELTGLTDDDLAGAPHLRVVLPELTRFVGDRTVVGHSVGFDLSFLRRWSVLCDNSSQDTFKLSTILVPGANRYSLEELATHLGFPPSCAHRALDDARTSHQLFVHLFRRALGLPTSLLEELVQHGQRVNWHATDFFRRALRTVARGAFVSTIGTQLAAKRGRSEGAPIFAAESKAPPLEPKEIRDPLEVEELASLLEEDGAFAQGFPGYEHRPQQVDMLRAVAEVLNESTHLMVEAPTGVGKSLAYLVPAVYWAVQNEERVIISTNTINLQEQLYRKDLPELAQILPVDFRAVVLKGRSHYLCPARLAALRRVGPSSSDEADVLARVLVWLPNTRDGDADDLFLPSATDRAIWQSLSARFEGCSPERCRYFRRGDCFFYRARRAAESAHLVIVNHALLLADVAVQNRALPEYRFLIVDEAHHLESATTSALSFETDRDLVRGLLREVGHLRGAGAFSGVLERVVDCFRSAKVNRQAMDKVQDVAREVGRAVKQARGALERFFDRLEEFVESERGGRDKSRYSYRLRVTSGQRIQPGWDRVEIAWDGVHEPLFKVLDGLEQLTGGLEDLASEVEGGEDLEVELLGLTRRLARLHGNLSAFASQPNENTIYWLEVGPRDDPLSVHTAPLHVGELVQEYLFHKKESVILTSATLQTGASFDFLRDRLHAWDAVELAVDSPFDYESSTLVYIVNDIPQPGQRGYRRSVGEGMTALFRATQGRALGLFTSYSQLRWTARAISAPLSKDQITVYAQGQGLSRNQLLENFRTGDRTVLLGTRSFWEGVDVPGDALSCLAIAKLPFNVPSDPIFAARAETFEDPFSEYAVPEAALRFLQGFGRLIRTRTDRGVVAIFDKRLVSRSYGSFFLESLPNPTIYSGSVLELPELAEQWLEDPSDVEIEDRLSVGRDRDWDWDLDFR